MNAWILDFLGNEPNLVQRATETQRLQNLRSLDLTDSIHFCFGCLQPEEHIGHVHAEAEIFFVLSGYGEASWIEAGRLVHRELKPGLALYVMPYTFHQLCNTGQQPLEGLLYHTEFRRPRYSALSNYAEFPLSWTMAESA